MDPEEARKWIQKEPECGDRMWIQREPECGARLWIQREPECGSRVVLVCLPESLSLEEIVLVASVQLPCRIFPAPQNSVLSQVIQD